MKAEIILPETILAYDRQFDLYSSFKHIRALHTTLKAIRNDIKQGGDYKQYQKIFSYADKEIINALNINNVYSN